MKIHLNIILPSTAGSPKWYLSLRFPHQTLYTPLLSPYALHAPPISFFSILSPEQSDAYTLAFYKAMEVSP